MKAVILEIIKGRAVVMKADGSVTKIRNKNYSVGDEIYMKEGIFSHRRWAPIVAALLIFAMVGTGTWAYATPAYQVSLIEEEGVEILIKVNRLDKVLDIIVRNNEGEEISLEDGIESKDLEEVLDALIEKYDIESESRFVFMTTMSDDKVKSDALAERIKENIINDRAQEVHERNEERKEIQADDDDDDDIDYFDENMEVKGLSPEDVERAKILGLTPGHYNIITNLMAVEDEWDDIDDTPKGDFKDYTEMTKQEIMEEFSASRGEKNGVKFQDDEKDNEEKIEDEKDTPPGQTIKDQKQEEHKPEMDSDEIGKPEKTTGKPEGVGNSKGNSGN